MDDFTERSAPPEWIDTLERARAEVDAGRTVDGAEVRARLRESIRQMQAEREARTPPER